MVLVLWARVSFCVGCPGTLCSAKAGLLCAAILLPQPHKCWGSIFCRPFMCLSLTTSSCLSSLRGCFGLLGRDRSLSQCSYAVPVFTFLEICPAYRWDHKSSETVNLPIALLHNAPDCSSLFLYLLLWLWLLFFLLSLLFALLGIKPEASPILGGCPIIEHPTLGSSTSQLFPRGFTMLCYKWSPFLWETISLLPAGKVSGPGLWR